MERYERVCGFCGGVFTTGDWRENYCGEGCRQDAARRRHRLWLAEQSARKRRRKARPPVSVEQVVAFAEDHRRRTGKVISYGQAVVMLDKQKGKGVPARVRG